MSLSKLMLWAFERLYNEAAWAYDLAAAVAGGEFWYEWGRTALPFVQAEPVLEVGVGRGRLLAELTDRGYEPFGLDLSPAMLRYARRTLAGDRALRAHLIRADGTALPFAPATFGTLITVFPAPYIRERATHREFARVVRPGGRWVWVDAPSGRGSPGVQGGLTTLLGGPQGQAAQSPVLALLQDDPTGRFDVAIHRVEVGPTVVIVRVATRAA